MNSAIGAPTNTGRCPTPAALLCPGFYQYLKGEKIEGLIFFVIAVISFNGLMCYWFAPSEPFGRNTVRAAIAAIALTWSILFSILDSYQKQGRAALYIILFPAVMLFSVFTYFPIVWCIKLAFYDSNLGTLVFGGAKFVGPENFVHIVHDRQFWQGLSNTIKFFLIGFVLGQVPAPLLAYLLNEVQNRHVQTLYKAICFVPSLFSWPIIGSIWIQLLIPGGQLDLLTTPILSLAGVHGVSWLGDPTTARVVFVCVGLWMGTGSTALIWLASLVAIDPTLYEAAEIDGAGHWTKFQYITLPLLIPTWVVITILSFIGMFAIFDQVLVMENARVREGVFVVMIHIFEQGMRFGRVGYAAAMSLILAAMVFVLTIVNLRIQRRWSLE